MEPSSKGNITLKFQSTHESITDLTEIELPPFTLITGLNGAGKSHLLQAIANRKILVVDEQSRLLSVTLHTWETLNPTNINSAVDNPVFELNQEDTKELEQVVEQLRRITNSQSRNDHANTIEAVGFVKSSLKASLSLTVEVLQNRLGKSIWECTDEEINNNLPAFINTHDPFTINLYSIFSAYQRKLYMDQITDFNDDEATDDPVVL